MTTVSVSLLLHQQTTIDVNLCRRKIHYDLNPWDVVATILFKISEMALCDFLQAENQSLRLVQKLGARSNSVKFLIWRKGNEVLVCHRSELNYCMNLLTLGP
jgi:hypothetical protein